MSNFDNFMAIQKLVWAGEPDFDKACALVQWLAEANAVFSAKDMTPEQKKEFRERGVEQWEAALKESYNG